MANLKSKSKPKRISLMERRRLTEQKLGALAPQFSLALDFGLNKNDLYLRMPLRRSWLFISIAGALLIVFGLPLFGLGGTLFEDTNNSLFSVVFVMFTLFWMLGWSAAVILIAILFVVFLIGRETLSVKDNKLILRFGIPGFGAGLMYDGELIRNFRSATGESDFGNTWRGEHLAFDYAGDPVHFGSAIEGERAERILQQLCTLFREQSQPPPEIAGLAVPAAVAASTTRKSKVAGQPLAGVKAGNEIALGSISTIALILANLIPLAGVLLDGWQVGEIMLLFWAESAVIGFYNLCKMWRIGRWSILFYGPFFVGHYGCFMVGHLLFIYGFFGSSFGNGLDATAADVLVDFLHLWPALLGFLISHGISYKLNFLGRQEYLNQDVQKQMGEPYKRIIIMHTTIIFGGFLALLFNTALPALMFLILIKTIADLRGHLYEHAVPKT